MLTPHLVVHGTSHHFFRRKHGRVIQHAHDLSQPKHLLQVIHVALQLPHICAQGSSAKLLDFLDQKKPTWVDPCMEFQQVDDFFGRVLKTLYLYLGALDIFCLCL